jgi:hypothetical protein
VQAQCDAARDAVGRQLAHQLDLLGGGADAPQRQGARQLVEQERVAAADLVTRRGERLGGLVVELGAQQQRGRVAAQSMRIEAPGERVGGDPRDVGRRAGLVRAGGDRDQHRQLVQPREQEAQIVERRRVGPVQVVDREQERPALGERRGQAVEAVEHGEAVPGAGGGAVARHAERTACGAGQIVAFGCGQRGQRRLEQLAHEREREVALQLGRTGGQDVQPRPFRDLPRGSEQARLAQSRRRLDHDQPASSRRRLGDGRLKLAQLPLTLQQRTGAGRDGTRLRALRLALHDVLPDRTQIAIFSFPVARGAWRQRRRPGCRC